MKVNFGFVRSAQTKLLANGTIRIYGALLDELKALRPGDILQLTDKNGRKYLVANWGDACPPERYETVCGTCGAEHHLGTYYNHNFVSRDSAQTQLSEPSK